MGRDHARCVGEEIQCSTRGAGDRRVALARQSAVAASATSWHPGGHRDDGQLQRLVAMGCDHAQGFLLSRPLPGDELETLLR